MLVGAKREHKCKGSHIRTLSIRRLIIAAGFLFFTGLGLVVATPAGRQGLLDYLGLLAPPLRPPLPVGITLNEKLVGKPAPDFLLRNLEGKPIHLRELAAQMPVVIEFGSMT